MVWIQPVLQGPLSVGLLIACVPGCSYLGVEHEVWRPSMGPHSTGWRSSQSAPIGSFEQMVDLLSLESDGPAAEGGRSP